MVRSMTKFLTVFLKRYLPTPYVLALILTLIIFVWGLLSTKSTVMNMVNYMGQGMTSLFAFTMQIVMILVTGHILASAPITERYMKKICAMPKTRGQAVMLTAFISYICGWFSWGFGLIAGALLAREIAVQNYGKKIDYPLIVAASYMSILGKGPASSIPLVVATKGHPLEKVMGIVPLSDTLFSSMHNIISLALLIIMPIVFYFMMPSEDEAIEVDLSKHQHIPEPVIDTSNMGFVDKLNYTPVLNYIIGTIFLVYLGAFFVKTKSLNFNVDVIIIAFLMFGFFAHKTPAAYNKAMQNAIKSAGNITLQFMFYAAIMGMMRGSGLIGVISDFFARVATAETLPFYTFVASSIVNFFVPSAGGQWAVQGPVMVDAAIKLGADIPKVVLAVTWGDTWTNLIQPFWALPILAIADLDIKDIMGYCAMALLASGVVLFASFLIL